MNINLTNSDIRFLLIQMAKMKRRPHYEIIVVRQVISAFHNNTEHKLKNEVLALADLSRRAGENQ
ncbi:hypothetical protein Acal02_01711 [Acinetobacter calcoaceticus]